jgi:hypothetical protein
VFAFPNGQNIRTCLPVGIYLLTFKDKRESEGSTGNY